jgi:hypothetical protein
MQPPVPESLEEQGSAFGEADINMKYSAGPGGPQFKVTVDPAATVSVGVENCNAMGRVLWTQA